MQELILSVSELVKLALIDVYKRQIPFASKVLVKSVVKSSRDKQGNVKVLLQKLEKGRDIIHEHALAV